MSDPCAVCGERWNRGDEPDPCLGCLPGVLAACCGHGEPDAGYVLFENGRAIYFDIDYEFTFGGES